MDSSCFKTKVLPVSKKLLNVTDRFLKNKEEGQDVVQDIMLKLWQKKDELDHVDNIEAYAIRMTRNRCLDLLRKSRIVHFDDEYDCTVEETALDVQSQLELSESAIQIKALIGNLKGLQKKVMELRDIEQLSYKEIAEVTSLKVNAIRVNLSRARKKVRDEFVKINSNGNKENKKFAAKIF